MVVQLLQDEKIRKYPCIPKLSEIFSTETFGLTLGPSEWTFVKLKLLNISIPILRLNSRKIWSHIIPEAKYCLSLSLSLMFISYVYIQSSYQTLPIKVGSGGFLKRLSSRMFPFGNNTTVLDFVPIGSVHFQSSSLYFIIIFSVR